MPHLTPDNQAGYHARLLSIPVPMLHHVRGVLDTLTFPYNWETYGDLTPDECVTMALEIIAQYDESDMIGLILAAATDDIPANSLICDGSVYDRADYPILYARLNAAYIIDEDTFEVPDLRSAFIMGTDTGVEVGDTGGQNEVTLETANLPAHSHDYDKTVVAASTVLGVLEGFELGAYESTPTSETGSATPYDNRPAFVALAYVIIAG